MSQEGLADAAIAALAAVRAMDAQIDNSHESRHVVRAMKRNAEQILADAFRRAHEMAYIAQDAHKTIEDAAGAPEGMA